MTERVFLVGLWLCESEEGEASPFSPDFKPNARETNLCCFLRPSLSFIQFQYKLKKMDLDIGEDVEDEGLLCPLGSFRYARTFSVAARVEAMEMAAAKLRVRANGFSLSTFVIF